MSHVPLKSIQSMETSRWPRESVRWPAATVKGYKSPIGPGSYMSGAGKYLKCPKASHMAWTPISEQLIHALMERRCFCRWRRKVRNRRREDHLNFSSTSSLAGQRGEVHVTYCPAMLHLFTKQKELSWQLPLHWKMWSKEPWTESSAWPPK